MKIAIYSPYLDTLGGGERYIATIAEVLSNDHEVDLLFDQHLEDIGIAAIKDNLSKRFNLNLEKVNTLEAPLGEDSNVFSRAFFLKKYDLLFYLTDGSIFLPSAKRNILHIQSPLVGQPAKSIWGRIKLKFWNLIIYNSRFTQDNSKKIWPLNSKIIYPPVDTKQIKVLKKKKYILSIGRFFGYLKDKQSFFSIKKHEVMIKAFRDLQKDAEGWSLHLVGSATDGDKLYLEELKKIAGNSDVNFYPNLEYSKLTRLLGEASIYWHAAGYGEEDPTKMEHFGIATVEAMAAECVPVVVNLGGQPEIVEDGISGLLWNSLEEFKLLTIRVIEDKDLRVKLSKNAKIKAGHFDKEIFAKNINELF